MNPLHQLQQKIIQQHLWEREVELARNQYLKVKGSIDTNIYLVEEAAFESLLLMRMRNIQFDLLTGTIL